MSDAGSPTKIEEKVLNAGETKLVLAILGILVSEDYRLDAKVLGEALGIQPTAARMQWSRLYGLFLPQSCISIPDFWNLSFGLEVTQRVLSILKTNSESSAADTC